MLSHVDLAELTEWLGMLIVACLFAFSMVLDGTEVLHVDPVVTEAMIGLLLTVTIAWAKVRLQQPFFFSSYWD